MVTGALTVVVTAIKIATVAGSGIALTTGFEWFHSFKYKGKKANNHPTMREGGFHHGRTESDHLRATIRSER